MTTTSLSFTSINAALKSPIETAEKDLNDKLSTLGTNPSTADLLVMQQTIQKFGIHINLQTTVVKELAETLKGIVQKSG